VAETDALDRLLVVAEAEGALGPERLADFALGLRERARLVLEDRVRPLEQRVRELETSAAALEKESAWRRETAAALEAQVSRLKQEGQRERAAHEQAAAALGEAQAAHGGLLQHHREVVGQVVQRLEAAAKLPWWRFRACRALLAEAAALFARELA
jgi:hypothetical protein